jgi:tRNA dimethylallyltransferase
MKNKLIVILGPTASGKTSLAANLAYTTNSEIISADSRQIYQGMDIGTGKDLSEYTINNQQIPYHLIDILNPIQDYSVFEFRENFFHCYDLLKEKNKNIILCGGTGLYIESVLLEYNIPNISPDKNLRIFYREYSIDDLIIELKKINQTAYNPDFHLTKRRLIRTIEILKNKSSNSNHFNNLRTVSDYIVFGLKIKRENLLDLIDKRLENRFNDGMIEEVESLINNGISLERLKYFGLEYKIIGEFLFNQINCDEMKLKLKYAINKFSKRQMTFFRRMEKRGIVINWINKNEYENIDLLIKKYL